MLHMNASLFSKIILLCLSVIEQCDAQIFPQEMQSKAGKEGVCSPPMNLSIPSPKANDTYEYVQYKRAPFSSTTPLEGTVVARSQVNWGRASHKDLLTRIYAHPLFLRRSQIQRSISHSGDEARIQKFVNKVLSGRPVTIVMLGGSITVGHGTANYADSWPNRFFSWFSQAFPHPDHQFLNRAVPATTSSYVAPCVSSLVPSEADLVFLEYTLNDSAEDIQKRDWERRRQESIHCDNQIDSSTRRTMERMVRELLSQNPNAALVALHTWAPDYSIAMIPQKFYSGSEDFYTTIFAYYGMTVFSFRNMMAPLVRKQPDLKSRLWPRENDFHPSCVGTRYMADMLIGHFMDQIAHAAWLKHAKIMYKLPDDPVSFGGAEKLPPPLFEGNLGKYTTQCILEKQLPKFVGSKEGFEWMSEGEDKESKLGYVSTKPLSHLTLQVPLANVDFNGEDFVVGLGVLISWQETMGVVEVVCLQGCTCDRQQFSTFFSHSGWSMTFWQFLRAKAWKGSKECLVEVVNLSKTYSQGHRVKITSLLVSGELGTLSGSNTWLQEGIVHMKANRMKIKGL